MRRAVIGFCAAYGAAAIVLLWLGAAGLIDFHVCIKPPGRCVQQPKDATP